MSGRYIMICVTNSVNVNIIPCTNRRQTRTTLNQNYVCHDYYLSFKSRDKLIKQNVQ